MFPIQKLVERFENYTLLVTSAQKTRVGEKKSENSAEGSENYFAWSKF